LSKLKEFEALESWGREHAYEFPGSVKRIGGSRYRPFWIAAAVFIVLSGATYLLVVPGKAPTTDNGSNKPAIAQVIKPARAKATLTVSGIGSFVLDSVPDGAVLEGAKKTGAGALQYLTSTAGEQPVEHQVSTPAGGFYNLTLSDGTQVWLNAASNLSYLSVFTGKERRVRLSGEAYFAVSKQKDKPFVVETSSGDVTALGTQFNVKSYDQEIMTTSLVEGVVRVEEDKKGAALVMRPGNQVVIDPLQAGLKMVNDPDVESATGWKEGLFSFSRAGLPEVLKELERWYDVKMVYSPQAFAPSKFSGAFDRTLPLGELLHQLGPVVKARFQINGKIVTVQP